MAAEPTDAGIVYVGSDVSATSTGRLFRVRLANDNVTVTSDSITNAGTSDNSAPHADSRDMTVNVLGQLVEVDDGGIFRRSSPTTAGGSWHSYNGDVDHAIFVGEQHSVAYDHV